MARKPRIEYPGAFYHVIIRGNNRQEVFLDRQDYQQFLKRLKKYKNLYEFTLYAFVLMRNHVHLLLETASTPLSKIMQGVDQSYTQYFNVKYNRVGHLFQGRYKAILCDKNSYFMQLIRYIHLNPERAGLKDPLSYPWSSHLEYMAKESGSLINVGFLLKHFSANNKIEARKRYFDFILGGMGQGHIKNYYKVKKGQLLGDDEFIEKVECKQKAPVAALIVSNERKKSLEQLLVDVCKKFNLSRSALIGGGQSKTVSNARRVLISQAVNQYGSKNKEVAQFLHISPSTVSMALKRYLRDKYEDGEFGEA